MTIIKESFSSLPYPLDSDEQNYPWLLLQHGDYIQKHTFYSISKNKPLIDKKIAEFRLKKAISTSHRSWLASIQLGQKALDFCLLNPRTKQKIKLPKILQDDGDYQYYRCVLSHPPTNPNCHVLLIQSLEKLVSFCRIGDEKFVSRANQFGPENNNRISSPVNFDGKIYAWMSRSRTLVQVDFGKDIIIIKKVVNDKGQPCHIPNPMPSCIYTEQLVESESELLLVHGGYSCQHLGKLCYFTIFRIDVSKGEWKELRSIGDRTIFFDWSTSKSWLCTNNGGDDDLVKKNSIYFVGDDRILYVYDIEDRSKTVVKLPHAKCFASWVFM